MRTFIPQTDPKANYRVHKQAIDEAIQQVLESGWYILGETVANFEKLFAEYIGVRHAIGVASGTDALHLALRAIGVKSGDVVVTVSHTAVATVAAIELAGAIPFLIDIDPNTFTMSPEQLDIALKKSEKRPVAIIPVHLYGHPANMSEIRQIAQRYEIPVLEDCAQSVGATWQNVYTGALGDIGAFSFYPTKNLGALGDGGMVVTNDDSLAQQVRLWRQYGWEHRYISKQAGSNSRLDPIHAAVLGIKLPYLDKENTRRQQIAQHYSYGLSNNGFGLPTCHPQASHVYHQYVIRTSRRDELQVYLRNLGIGTLIHYPQAVHMQPAYKNKIPHLSLDSTEEVVAEILSLPMYPELDDTTVGQVIDALTKW
jgi:dTDP-4-amino-4,6-dideoxygalactose transaminase